MQLALLAVMEHRFPELRDREYGLKLAGLRARLAAEPGRPLVLIMGNSRVAVGFRPEALPGCWPTGDPPPVVHTFSMIGNGPTGSLLCLHRLLADGIHPDWVFIEVWPVLWAPGHGVRRSVDELAWSDLHVLRRYPELYPRLYWRWCRTQLPACLSHRLLLLQRFAPWWLPPALCQDNVWFATDRTGWLSLLQPFDDKSPSADPAVLWGAYSASLCRSQVDEVSDRALRETLATGRREGIRVGLVYMPEMTVFRDLYPPVARAVVEEYLDRLSQEFQAPLIDTRSWMPDAEFADAVHLRPRGAAAFTERFGREVIQPLLNGGLRAESTGPGKWGRGGGRTQ
jgi:hypothetical protein